MRRAFGLVGVLLAVSSYAKDPAYPTVGLLHHTTEGSSLQYSCALKGKLLECEMSQTFVRRDLKDQDIPKRGAALMTEILKQPLTKVDCKSIMDTGDEFTNRLKDPSSIPAEYKQEFDLMSQAQKDSTLEYLRLVAEVCKTNSFGAKQALRDHLVNDEAGSCKVGTNSWKETFRHQFAASGSVWLSSGEPNGECGVVQLNRFEMAKDAGSVPFWNYIARKAITNPTAEMPLFGKCTGLDEGTYIYSWKSRDHFLSCKKIKFSVL